MTAPWFGSLEGAAITERDLVASALNLSPPGRLARRPLRSMPATESLASVALRRPRASTREKRDRKSDLNFFISAHRGVLFAVAIFVVMFTLYVSKHPAGFSAKVINTAAIKGTLLALVAMAQTIPVLTAGLDLSVGMVFVLANCIASNVLMSARRFRRPSAR